MMQIFHFLNLYGICSVTEAGEGEDGRMKSAIGIGALLMDGLGDTIRVSLTEDPEYEMAPCRYSGHLHHPPSLST